MGEGIPRALLCSKAVGEEGRHAHNRQGEETQQEGEEDEEFDILDAEGLYQAVDEFEVSSIAVAMRKADHKGQESKKKQEEVAEPDDDTSDRQPGRDPGI